MDTVGHASDTEFRNRAGTEAQRPRGFVVAGTWLLTAAQHHSEASAADSPGVGTDNQGAVGECDDTRTGGAGRG